MYTFQGVFLYTARYSYMDQFIHQAWVVLSPRWLIIIMVHPCPWDNGIDDVNLFVMISISHLHWARVKPQCLDSWSPHIFQADGYQSNLKPVSSLSGQVPSPGWGQRGKGCDGGAGPGWWKNISSCLWCVLAFLQPCCVFPSPRSLGPPRWSSVLGSSLSSAHIHHTPSCLWADVSIDRAQDGRKPWELVGRGLGVAFNKEHAYSF